MKESFLRFTPNPLALCTDSKWSIVCLCCLITARKCILRKLCFHRCLSVHRRGVCLPHCMLGYPSVTRGRHPPPRTRGRHPPQGPEADTPPPPRTRGRHPPGQTPPVHCMLGYGQQAGGTHPTGMHSCSHIF